MQEVIDNTVKRINAKVAEIDRARKLPEMGEETRRRFAAEKFGYGIVIGTLKQEAERVGLTFPRTWLDDDAEYVQGLMNPPVPFYSSDGTLLGMLHRNHAVRVP